MLIPGKWFEYCPGGNCDKLRSSEAAYGTRCSSSLERATHVRSSGNVILVLQLRRTYDVCHRAANGASGDVPAWSYGFR